MRRVYDQYSSINPRGARDTQAGTGLPRTRSASAHARRDALMIRAFNRLSPGRHRASFWATRLTFSQVRLRAIRVSRSFLPRRRYMLRLSRILLSMVQDTYPAPSHIVMTWCSSALDANARTSRTMPYIRRLRVKCSVQYEELKRDPSRRQFFRVRDSPSLTRQSGQSDSRSSRSLQLPHSN